MQAQNGDSAGDRTDTRRLGLRLIPVALPDGRALSQGDNLKRFVPLNSKEGKRLSRGTALHSDGFAQPESRGTNLIQERTKPRLLRR